MLSPAKALCQRLRRLQMFFQCRESIGRVGGGRILLLAVRHVLADIFLVIHDHVLDELFVERISRLFCKFVVVRFLLLARLFGRGHADVVRNGRRFTGCQASRGKPGNGRAVLGLVTLTRRQGSYGLPGFSLTSSRLCRLLFLLFSCPATRDGQKHLALTGRSLFRFLQFGSRRGGCLRLFSGETAL